jgi:UDP-N-acetylmuramate dehydrogenase
MTPENTPPCVKYGQSVAAMTYYGIGGHAEFLAEPRSLAELLDCLQWAQGQKLPIAVFGSGSNSLLADGPFSGLVITLSKLTNAYWETSDTLFAEAGVSNTELAEICLDAGRAGAAWMYRMPGQLGATVRMNARCYGGEISQIAEHIFTIDMHGRLRIHNGKDVFYGYKKTLLMDEPEIVVAARLRLKETADRSALLNIMQTCEADRHRKHHFDFPSCGSTFKNNYTVGRPSGQVFDECGLKGARLGRSEVSQYHANFVWNLGGTTAKDMLGLAAYMRERALTLKNADLELEVQPMGLFDHKTFTDCALDRLGPSLKEDASHWVGLFWHPALESQVGKTAEFPRLLMQSPFQHYFRAPNAGQPEVQVRLLQLMSLEDASRNPDKPFLRWETSKSPVEMPTDGWSPIFPLKPSSSPDFLDNLWNFSVSELFIAHGNSASGEYLEFEMTPEGHWIAIAFDAPRKRKSEHTTPAKNLWPELPTALKNDRFSMNLPYKLLQSLIHNGALRVQACLSLGGEGWFLAPHWAPSGSEECWDTQHKPDVKPDFHQPRRFWRIALH